MNIPKAIEILQAIIQADERDFPLISEDAMKLGIEALKRIKEQRDPRFPFLSHFLPEETEK